MTGGPNENAASELLDVGATLKKESARRNVSQCVPADRSNEP